MCSLCCFQEVEVAQNDVRSTSHSQHAQSSQQWRKLPLAMLRFALCVSHREKIGLGMGPEYCRTTSNIAPAGYDFLPNIVASTHHQLAKEDD